MTELPVSISHNILTHSRGVSILYLKCQGVYHFGSAGKPEAVEIYQRATQLLHTTSASALLLDYAELDYQWGDDLMLTFQIDNPHNPSRALPLAVVVGAKCQAAIKSLLETDGGFKSWLDAGFIFFEITSAVDHLLMTLHLLKSH